MSLEIVPISLKEANVFVEEHHRHHHKTAGHKFSIGCSDGNKIVGVAIVGRPVARHLDDGETLEVNRLCTDGTYNACSMLYAAAWRAARAMGYKRLVTYILDTENGTSLRAAGWKCIGQAGGLRWTGKRRPEVDLYREMELKLCPFCGREAVLEELCGTWYVRCTNCEIGSSIFSDPQKAVERWNRRYEPPNEPLTLKELREMGGEPYWHVGLQKASPPPHWNILDPFYAQHIEDYGYERRWLAYRRKPKETQT